MVACQSILRLYLLDDRRLVDLDRASLIIDRLAARRRVAGAPPEWRVFYKTDDHTRAMEICARDLGDLDPQGVEIFDFAVVRPLCREH